MTLAEYVADYREKHDLSIRAMASLVGVSPQHMSNVESGINNNGKPMKLTVSLVSKIAKATGIDELTLFETLDDFATVNPKKYKQTPVISELERKYRALDDHGRELVDAVLGIEYARCAKPAPVEQKAVKIIPLFPAAAGPGEPMETTAFQEHEVDADSKAQFAVRISGDSMEPELHDGEIVLCARRVPQIGEIAVIMVNGFLYVKQYIADSFGNIYLRSLNRQRKDLDVDIMASGNDTVTGYGVVIHRRVPLVRE